MIDLDYWSERALSEASDGTNGEFAVGRSYGEFVCLALIHTAIEAEIEAQTFEQVARAASMARRAAADADRMVALGFAIEECVEGDDAEDLREREVCFRRYVSKRIETEVLAGMMFLDVFQDA